MSVVLDIEVDARPVKLVLALAEIAAELCEPPFDAGDFPLEPVRVESDLGATRAGVCAVRLYPSDALLNYLAAGLAAKVERLRIENASHEELLGDE